MAAVHDQPTVEIVAFPKGAVLFKQGDRGEATYILNSGAIGLYRESQGRRMPIASMRRGEMFGEMALTDGGPRLATAYAIEDSVVMVVPAGIMRARLRA